MQWLMVGRGGAVRRRRQARGGWRGSKGTDTREKTKKAGGARHGRNDPSHFVRLRIGTGLVGRDEAE